jgi:stage V sporulation protein R
VVYQPRFEDKHFGGLNPYALGFAIMRDIKRISEEPTAEDRAWFPQFAGNGDALGNLKEAWANFRDDSFILQYLSPRVIRDLRLFQIHDNAGSAFLEVKAIHDETGYRKVRKVLAEQYNTSARDPDIQVINADLAGGRRLVLQHRVRHGVLLDKEQCDRTLQHVAHLWGYRVKLIEVDAETGKTLKEHETLPLP